MLRSFSALAPALALALLSPASGLAAPSAAADAAPTAKAAQAGAVHITGFAFVPQTITVAPGTTVTWTNADDDPHSVVATDKRFRSAALDTGEHYAFTFTAPGDYAYFCSLHPHMTGHVIVKPD